MPRKPQGAQEKPGVTQGGPATMILAILHDGARHGYHIAREVQVRSNGALSFNEGTLYSVLHALEKEQMITSEWEKVTGERARRVYRLTPNGEAELQRLVAQWNTYSKAMNSVLGNVLEEEGPKSDGQPI